MLPSPFTPRVALADRTNDTIEDADISPCRAEASLPTSPHDIPAKRKNVENEGAAKRARLNKTPCKWGADEEEKKSAEVEDGERENVQQLPLRRRRLTVYGSLRALAMGDRAALRSFNLPTCRILESFVSSHKTDMYKCRSMSENSFLTPPYACAFSHDAKRGRQSTLAVATEQGAIDIINASRRLEWEQEPARTTLQVHNNGIFDVKWSPSDALLASASGDHTVRVVDPRSSGLEALHILRGHSSTVKCIAWDPAHADLLASGGRDGCICLWDLRARRRAQQDDEDRGMAPVMTVPWAHEAAAGKPTRIKRNTIAVAKSVTSLLYLPDSPYHIVSSGPTDGILRKWDLRFVPPKISKKSKTIAAELVLPVEEASKDRTTFASYSQSALTFSPRRARGISSLALGSGPSVGRIFALSIDSRVHTYNAYGAAGTPLGLEANPGTLGEIEAYSHPRMVANSFYVRIGVSQCGRWLASGGANGSAFLFDVGSRTFEGVELKGQDGEVGALDWADGALATCADDGTVRIWRPDVERHRECLADPETMKWSWSWGTPG